MRYVSVDIGSRNCGLATATISETEKTLNSAYSMYLEPKLIQDRLVILCREINSLIGTFKPDHIIFELPFLRGANQHDVYFCTGMIYLCAGKYNLPVSKVTATEAKKLVTGTGKADKKHIEREVRKFYSLSSDFMFDKDHASDAACFPICHYLKNKSDK